METYSYIEITFTEDLTNETISFDAGDIGNSETFQVLEQWTTFRGASNQVTASQAATAIPGERSAINFLASFNSDYNTTGLYLVVRTGTIVRISSLQYGLDFDLSSFASPASVSATVITATVPPFVISSVSFSAGSSICTNVLASVQTSSQADEYSIDGGNTFISVTTNPFTLTLSRQLSYNLIVNKSTTTREQVVTTPAKFFNSSILLNINDNPSGSIVTASVDYPEGPNPLSFEFSLDGITYDITPTFTNMVQGDYTIHVKDNFGCVRTKNFQLSGFGSRSPFFAISKSNSIRYARKVIWGDSANYKNDENTLSNEVEVPLAKQECQLFNSSDVITTQFKSSYQNNNALVRVCDNIGLVSSTFNQTVVKKTNNMGLSDSRDAIKFAIGDGRTGIYFNTGNIYDYDSGSDIGDYTLNGSLPVWGVIGNYVKIGSNWYLIEDVLFIESKNAECLIVSGLLSTNFDVEFIAGCLYDLFNYEVYEFEIDMFSFLQYGLIRVEINATDTYYDDLDYNSEICSVKVRHENTIEINYWNKHNTDVFYATGIKHKIRIPLEKVSGRISEESETLKTDTDAILLTAQVYELDEFEFDSVTKEIMRKIIQAVHHSEVYIGGVRYVKESVDVEGPIDETNLYIVKATMIKAQNVYNSDSGIIEFNEGSFEVPGLIGNGEGFIKYQ